MTFLQHFNKILLENYLAFFLQAYYILQETLYLSVRLARYMQGTMQDISSLARKLFGRIAYFLQDGFCWVCLSHMKALSNTHAA